MADSVALSVQLAGAEAALAQLTQLDSVVKSLKANRNINISVNSRSLSTAADRAAQLNTNLQESSNTAKQMGTAGARNINQAGQALDKASRNAESFRLGMGSVVLNMAKFRLASSAINLVANGFKEAFKEMKSVDTELVNIRKVTGFTNEEIEKLSQNAYALASQYGRSASEVLEASTVFARAGYTDQIDQLSELSLLLQNVGDLQAEDASKFVIATDKAYKLGGSYEDLMAVIDGLDNITNKNATDMQKMTEGMTVAGSVFAESGESIQTFAALLGTATANTQRSGSEVARGLRTILMNLRQIRGETEDGELIDGESIAAAAKALKDYANISTMENGQLRKASDVLTELAGKWDTLTETQRAAISEAVAGKRQANILMSLMGDWESVQKMMGEYENSAGTAAKENEAYMDSWAAKVEQVKANWTELVASIVDSDIIIGALEGVNNFLDRLNGRNPAVKAMEEQKKEAQETVDAYEADYGEYGRYENLSSHVASLTAEEKAELVILEAKKKARQEEYEAALKLLNLPAPESKEEKTAAQTATDLAVAINSLNNEFRMTNDAEVYRMKLSELVVAGKNYYDTLVEAKKAGNDLSANQQSWKAAYELLTGALVNGSNDIEVYGQAAAAEVLALGESAEEAEAQGNQAMEDFAEDINAVPSEKVITITVKGYEEATGKLGAIGSLVLSGLQNAGLPQHASGTPYAPGGPSLVNERGPEIISANGIAYVAAGGNPAIVNLPRGATVLNASRTKKILNNYIPAYANEAGNPDETYRKLVLASENDDTNGEGPVIVNMPRGAKVLLNGEELIGPAFLNRDGAGGGGGGAGGGGGGAGGGSSQVKSFKDLEEELNDRLKNLDAQAKLAENEEDFLKAMQIYGEAQDYIAELLDKYRDAGYAEDSDEILRLANLGYDYAAKQLGGYDKLQQNLIDALNELTKATEDANELAERQAAVDKAREALANAESQRTVRIFNPVTGQWEWVANAGDVARAQENLKNAEESLRKEELSQAISAIQNADAESLGNMTLSPAILDALFGATPEQQSAFLNALGAATGGANWLSSSAAQTAWNQGSSIGTQYNLNGINLTPEQASGMTIMQLITMLQGLKIM